jgi:DNA polymerase theta
MVLPSAGKILLCTPSIFLRIYCGLIIEGTNTDPPENWLEIVRQRWNKIGEIMGKGGVPKFMCNLKVQLQVLNGAVVSIQRYGLSRKVSIPELIDSLHLMLSPINIKETIYMCIVAWILWPDEERSFNLNLEKVMLTGCI